MWTEVKLSWLATCHSYDVIELVSKCITGDSAVFIPVSIGAKGIKIDQKSARGIVENKVAPFLSRYGVVISNVILVIFWWSITSVNRVN